MIEFYIGFTVLLVAIIGMLVLRKSAKKKKAEQERKDAAWQQLKEMRDAKYKLMRAEESERSRLRSNYQTTIPDATIAKMQSIRSSSRTVAPSSTVAVAPTPVSYDSSSDLLTNMIILNALASHNDTTAGTVSWKDDTPTITPVAASSYSAPEPEPERSSYTSSYSSSSSDSSYSSSSSDSSYSSSSSDSSSSYSSD